MSKILQPNRKDTVDDWVAKLVMTAYEHAEAVCNVESCTSIGNPPAVICKGCIQLGGDGRLANCPFRCS